MRLLSTTAEFGRLAEELLGRYWELTYGWFCSTLPTDVKNKYFLAAKIITFGVLGFGTPFYAAYWHM